MRDGFELSSEPDRHNYAELKLRLLVEATVNDNGLPLLLTLLTSILPLVVAMVCCCPTGSGRSSRSSRPSARRLIFVLSLVLLPFYNYSAGPAAGHGLTKMQFEINAALAARSWASTTTWASTAWRCC